MPSMLKEPAITSKPNWRDRKGKMNEPAPTGQEESLFGMDDISNSKPTRKAAD